MCMICIYVYKYVPIYCTYIASKLLHPFARIRKHKEPSSPLDFKGASNFSTAAVGYTFGDSGLSEASTMFQVSLFST